VQRNRKASCQALHPGASYERTFRRADLYILAGLVVVLVAVIIVDMGVRRQCTAASDTLSQHLLVPKSFILEYPDCAEKLVQAADITNVHIMALQQTHCRLNNTSTRDNESAFPEEPCCRPLAGEDRVASPAVPAK